MDFGKIVLATVSVVKPLCASMCESKTSRSCGSSMGLPPRMSTVTTKDKISFTPGLAVSRNALPQAWERFVSSIKTGELTCARLSMSAELAVVSAAAGVIIILFNFLSIFRLRLVAINTAADIVLS